MENFWFYIELGFWHVLDFSAYDHILFLAALTVPFVFKNWKSVLLLATLFTVAHCTSLALSVYGIVTMDTTLIEFLIPVTICLTAVFNIIFAKSTNENGTFVLHFLAAGFFGLIHGFGFSNYFRMLMAEETDKLTSLLGFATGIEFSQIIIILAVLELAHIVQTLLLVERSFYIIGASILLFLVTIPMLFETFPW
ncbi:HupE/UreJ family protein [Aurantibacter crassamenti]|uniref:HupE/UreJ family protein n=1 Tax=Aurantibacter crassamenti TaxID=1837375 RepID=UPI0019396908|nr:HupE/UreJ family protein [Aurantibacter crassamenti]MBM1105379.1 HupE/UreJ family protein [Aurantibacter crassamenti]